MFIQIQGSWHSIKTRQTMNINKDIALSLQMCLKKYTKGQIKSSQKCMKACPEAKNSHI